MKKSRNALDNATLFDGLEVWNPWINSNASGFDLLHASHVGFRFFFDRFWRKTFEKCLQILREGGWFPENARIRHDDRTTHLPSLPCRKDPPRRARDLLGNFLLTPSRSSWDVLRFFRSRSPVWNIVAKLSVAGYRTECGEKFSFRVCGFLKWCKSLEEMLYSRANLLNIFSTLWFNVYPISVTNNPRNNRLNRIKNCI